MRYKYECKGNAADNQTWMTKGEISTAREGDFPIALQQAMMASFEQLTKGKAVFGLPGVGCKGPYTISTFFVERISDD